jgi:hypothetical protein
MRVDSSSRVVKESPSDGKESSDDEVDEVGDVGGDVDASIGEGMLVTSAWLLLLLLVLLLLLLEGRPAIDALSMLQLAWRWSRREDGKARRVLNC